MDTKNHRDRENRNSRQPTNNKMNSADRNSRTGTDVRSTARGSKRNSRIENGSRGVYVAAGLGVVALLLGAFFLPQLLFHARDSVLCSDTVLSERESVDVLIGDSYEPSLYNRMYNFAEGLSRGVSYYVSEQDMGVDEELYYRLNGLSLEPVQLLMDCRLITPSFVNYFMIQQRKQYVIYSDDYAQGVNFVIWYVELIGPSGTKLELLMDAETSVIYGIKAEKNSAMTQDEIDSWLYYSWSGNLAKHLNSSGMVINDLWLYLAMEFEAISMSELEPVYYTYNGEKYPVDSDPESNEERLKQLAVLSEGEWQDENSLTFSLPYEEYLLTLKIQITPEVPWPTYRYHDVFYGIEAICRMIPEFTEEN